MAWPKPAGQWRIPALPGPSGHGLHEFGPLPEQAVQGRQVGVGLARPAAPSR